MKNVRYFLVALCLLVSAGAMAQNADEIQWVEFEDALEMQKESPKKIMMFVYTDWCDFCRYTKNTLLTYPPFIKELNELFIPVKFNAEQTENVQFMGHDLGIQEESGYHYLPIILMDGKMEFPGFIFFDENGKVISQQNGVKEDVQDFTDYVTYIGTDAYLKTKWLDYNPTR